MEIMEMTTAVISGHAVANLIAGFAQESLLEEVYLTPKPGLVDMENNGSHHDLTLSMMELSALALRPAFYDMAEAAMGKLPSQSLREQLAAIGRYGEQQMLQVTGKVNTHKGAIWCIGLLSAATAILVSRGFPFSSDDLLSTAGLIARFEDRFQPADLTNGSRVRKKYNVVSAREEAQLGFPTLAKTALPVWEKYQGETEDVRRLNVLLSLMSVVDDTCILYRSDMDLLAEVQQKACEILAKGGMGIEGNLSIFYCLENLITKNRVSPGGSADLLAATIFIKKVINHFKFY